MLPSLSSTEWGAPSPIFEKHGGVRCWLICDEINSAFFVFCFAGSVGLHSDRVGGTGELRFLGSAGTWVLIRIGSVGPGNISRLGWSQAFHPQGGVCLPPAGKRGGICGAEVYLQCDHLGQMKISLPAQGTSDPQGPAGVGGSVPAPPPSSSYDGLPSVSRAGTGGEGATAPTHLKEMAERLQGLSMRMEDLARKTSKVEGSFGKVNPLMEPDGTPPKKVDGWPWTVLEIGEHMHYKVMQMFRDVRAEMTSMEGEMDCLRTYLGEQQCVPPSQQRTSDKGTSTAQPLRSERGVGPGPGYLPPPGLTGNGRRMSAAISAALVELMRESESCIKCLPAWGCSEAIGWLEGLPRWMEGVLSEACSGPQTVDRGVSPTRIDGAPSPSPSGVEELLPSDGEGVPPSFRDYCGTPVICGGGGRGLGPGSRGCSPDAGSRAHQAELGGHWGPHN
ncbi:hypothetical protein EAG_08325 [Camponotus floridanus]|uniref:Uncharacterized protein n=1 Tax=Camponotus floridanus TaxID=104421 RepID=E2A4C0_CAMFO|nr:hypothetical protein EAG_08325 [Camponotus floridanus]